MSDQAEFLKRTMDILSAGPTAAELDLLVSSYAQLGYIAAEAERLAEEAENMRKHETATAYLAAKRSAEKVTEREAEALAELAIKDFRDAEVVARTRARKTRNLLDAVEHAINAVKALSRHDSRIVG